MYNVLPLAFELPEWPLRHCGPYVWHKIGSPLPLGLSPGTAVACYPSLQEVVWGVDALFSDLLNPDDPLNVDAAEQYKLDQAAFRRKVIEYINQDQYQRKT